MNVYAISQWSRATYDAAGKAMRDVFSVIGEKGAKTIWSVPKTSKKYMKVFDLPYLAALLLFKAKREDYLFYSFPENKIKIKMLKAFRKIRGYKIICFINDLNAVRHGDPSTEDGRRWIAEEISMIAVADYILAPNKSTIVYLRDHGVTSHIIPVGVWDYLMEPQLIKQVEERQRDKEQSAEDAGVCRIAYAGNLNKAEFLRKIPIESSSGIEIEAWGILKEGGEKELSACCHYNGKVLPEEIPLHVCTMDYGLVWDGNGDDEISGNFGTYLRYNNSHKCGLYLSSGIPVIVWREAGLAHFVREHECGILIDRLSEIPERIAAADYDTLKKNAGLVAERLRRGGYLSDALDAILQ